MHAFLFTGTSKDDFKNEINSLAATLYAKIMEFNLNKIEDVRNLNDILRLSFSSPTLVVAKNIENATTEAMNAFLKNLEEPQEQVYFALTTSNKSAVLPTIISRCQIIKIKFQNPEIKDNIPEFINANAGLKLKIADKIKDRSLALNFLENCIKYLQLQKEYKYMDTILTTLNNIKANGNISLQLTALVVRMENANG